MSLKQQITDDMKAAMKSGDKHTVGSHSADQRRY